MIKFDPRNCSGLPESQPTIAEAGERCQHLCPGRLRYQWSAPQLTEHCLFEMQVGHQADMSG